MHWECLEHFPHHRFQRKLLASDPSMHYVTCVMHLSWYMSELLTHDGGENVPGIPGACPTQNFAYVSRDPWYWLSSITWPLSFMKKDFNYLSYQHWEMIENANRILYFLNSACHGWFPPAALLPHVMLYNDYPAGLPQGGLVSGVQPMIMSNSNALAWKHN